ncbi:MAG TPA: multicopper oxidase domain-containing protein [Solirubrobacterales bacterium]
MRPQPEISEEAGSFLMTRNGFLKAAAASAVALGTAGGASLLGGSPARAARPPEGGPLYPLYIPPTTSPQSLSLTEAPAVVDIGGGQSQVWAYNDSFPGPSIVASRGDQASIHLVNGLQQETITHWHGMIVDEANDGGPFRTIPPGGTYDYSFTINQRGCLNFYHPHPHELTGEQVNLGLAGAFIVRDDVEAGLGLPSGAREVPLLIRDATLDSAGNLSYKPRSGGFDGQIPLVNGTRRPFYVVGGDLYRFRVVNGANARIFGLTLSTGAPFTLIGNDGGFLETQSDLTRIDIAPGERLDLLVSFAGYQYEWVALRDARSNWDLLNFPVFSPGTGSVPTLALPSIPKLSNPVTTRTFSFDGMSKINGKEFDPNRIDFRVPFGTTELWRFTTGGNAPHPVHVHGASFQVQSRTGGRGTVFPWERGWKDTVLLEDRETVDVLIRFDGFRGRYVIHCHKLEHEDMGMMSAFEVY